MQHSHTQFQYAGFWRRLFAFSLDGLLLSIISSILIVTFFGYAEFATMQQEINWLQPDWQQIGIDQVIPALWTITFWYLLKATPGKLLVDAQIVDANSFQKASLSQLLLRYLCYLVSALPLGLGFLWIAINPRKQGWHDKLANTVVILQDDSLNPIESYS
jgi:uncharacterized RDD family membrane protein YckC